MGAYYLDTSALVKRYAAERGTAWVVALTDRASEHDLYTARVTGPEMIAALFRKVRNGESSLAAATRASHDFRIDWEQVDDHVRGVVIAPPGCETLHLTFGRTGRLIEYTDAPFQEQTPGRYGLIKEHLFTKTQFSSPEVHIQVCELLRIVEPYMAEWTVEDEGEYWGTWDEQVLVETWTRYEAALAALSDPATMQQLLKDFGSDIEVTKPPEVGKQLPVAQPLWRKEWGISAGEN